MTITVINKRHAGAYGIDSRAGEYIGRPTALGNPFVIGTHGTRSEVIMKYEQWFNHRLVNPDTYIGFHAALARLSRIAANGDLHLVCWCAPQQCHGDVIKKYIESTLIPES